MRQQVAGLCNFTVNSDAFFKVHQVRRGVDTRAVACLQKTSLQHGTGRTFAIGACHGHHGTCKTQIHVLRNLAHARQPHVDVDGMQTLAMGEPTL